MTFEFLVDFAADKDSLDVVAGTAHVQVEADNEVDARLTAEQMVAATGREPVAARVLDPGGQWPDDTIGWPEGIPPIAIVEAAPPVEEMRRFERDEAEAKGVPCCPTHPRSAVLRYSFDGLSTYECTYRGCEWQEFGVEP